MVNLDAPLGVGSYMMMSLIQCIPLVGFIMLLVWAFSRNANTNKKNYARAALIWWLIGLGLAVLAVVVMLLLGVSLGSLIGESYYYY
jgi:purine-cytosine permease-like protein